MNKNNSKIYTSAVSAKARLLAQIAQLDEYLIEGSGTTRIQFVGSRGQNLLTLEYNSNWTTAQGKMRVETLHKQFIEQETKEGTCPAGTVKVKVTSPFVTTQSVQAKTQVEATLPFSYTATA